MMRVWILDTHLPVALGHPQQRLSEALRTWFAQRAETRSVTIDLYQTEAQARLRRSAGDLLVPLRPSGQGSAGVAGAVSDRQKWRLGRLLRSHSPDLVVVGDPLLAPLLPQLAMSRAALRLIDDGTAAWHDLMARRVPSAAASAMHLQRAQSLRDAAGAFAPLMAVPPDAGPGLAFAEDARFFEKIPNIVSLATGDPEIDRRALDLLGRAVQRLAAIDLPKPEIALIGFAADLAARVEGAVAYDSWMHLEALVGSARVLVLPVLSPPLAEVAAAALCLGTPVVTGVADAALAGLAGVAGLCPAVPDAMAVVMARLLDPDITGAADWQAIAEAARLRRADRVRQEFPGLEMPARAPRRAAATPRRRRLLPLAARPEVLWNPLSRMLLLRLRYRRDAGVEEVRLLDAHGTELIRLMANANERKQDPVRVEGGVVTPLEALGGGLTVELHDAGVCLQSITLDTAEFTRIDTEIAWAHPDGVMLHGAFWLSDAPDGPADVVLTSGAARVDPVLGPPVAMPETGGRAFAFSVPLTLVPRVPVEIGRRLPDRWRSVEPLMQRALVPTPALLRPAPEPAPELAALKDLHRGRRAWIIGNGPSVRLEDLAAIPEGDIKFCFNRFYLSYGTHPLREDYVVSADTLMIADFGQDMIAQSTGLPLFCLAPAALPPLDGPHVVLPPFDGHLPLFSMNPAAFVGVGGSSVCVALQMAHYMGLRDVVLYGLDYSFSMKLQRDPRFPFPVSFDDGNHFIASYRSAKPWCPPTWRDISAGFLNARVAYETTGGRVRNATRGGKLDTFERADFDAVLAGDRAGAAP